MILWQKTIEITPELKKLKGHNYKGREIGPYYRLCNNCRDAKIEYKTYDRMLGAERRNEDCPKCNKNTKGTKGNFSKKCFTEDCSETILYKSKYSMLSGIKANTICQKCKNKMASEAYKNGRFRKILKDKYGEEGYEDIQKRRVIAQQKYWEEHLDQYQELIEKRKNPKAKFYEVGGIKCQGNCERQYIEGLIKSNKKLPIKPKPILTSIGYYFPDFEFEDKYVEIKSTYTYKILKTDDNPQYLKIKEVASKIKPVEIIVNRAKNGEVFFKELIT